MYRALLADTLPELRGRIAEAAARAGRDPGEVRVVAVTKGHPLAAVEAAVAAGLGRLGENRVAELEEKAGLVAGGTVEWHMIGRLQRRVAPRVRGLASLVHSLDSLGLAARLERTAPPGAPPLPVLAQVNVSGEATKAGFSPDELPGALEALLGLGSLEVRGLMTMAPFTRDERTLRTAFRGLRRLGEEAALRFPGYRGRELSMGMSNDYEWAVEEGSTIVRVGSAIFGRRP